MAEARARVYINGRVQGVFFRQFVKEAADRAGVYGWVKNLEDGRVEAVLEGDEEDVNRVIETISAGSPMSDVTDVQVTWEPYVAEFHAFGVVR